MMVKLKQLDKARAHLDSLPTNFFTASKEARQQIFNAKANLYRALGQPLEALACLDSIDYIYRDKETRVLYTQYVFQVRRKNLMLQLNRFDDARSILKKIVVLHRLLFERDMVTLTDAERLTLFGEFVFDVSTYEYLMRVAPTSETARDMADLLLFTHNLMENTARRTQNFVKNSTDSSMSAVYQKWLGTREQLQKAWNTPGIDPRTVEDLEKAAEKLEKKLSGYGVPIALQEKDVTWTDVRDALLQGEAAVALHHLVRVDWLTYEQSDAFVACILRPGVQEPEFVFLDNADELQVFGVQQFQREIDAKTPLSSSLYDKFWGAVAKKTAGAHTIFYAPDGFFHHINPNALRLADGRFLIDSVEIRQISNLRELPQLRKTESVRTSSARRRAVFLGNPKFDLFAARTPEPMAGNTLRDLAEEMETQGFLLRALPGSEVEVRSAGATLAARGWSVEMLVGAAATEDSLKKIASPNILHIATHGFYQKNEKVEVEHPGLRAMLFLAGSQNTLDGTNPEKLPNDGILTAYEASVLPLGGTDLVVLSACKSGQGKIIEGEGVFGLQRAFRIAGAKSLIMSLWEVEDAATAILMNTFYENWLGGLSKTEAFRRAQLTLKAKYPQPFYWGSFILVNG